MNDEIKAIKHKNLFFAKILKEIDPQQNNYEKRIHCSYDRGGKPRFWLLDLEGCRWSGKEKTALAQNSKGVNKNRTETFGYVVIFWLCSFKALNTHRPGCREIAAHINFHRHTDKSLLRVLGESRRCGIELQCEKSQSLNIFANKGWILPGSSIPICQNSDKMKK